MVKGILNRYTGEGCDQATGSFRDETQALMWATNMVGHFVPVKSIVRTQIGKLVEYTFLNKGDVKTGFAVIELR